MTMQAYFPAEPHHPLVEKAVEALLGDNPPLWADLKPNVQTALLHLRELSGHRRQMAELEAEIARLRRHSLVRSDNEDEDDLT